MTNVTFDEEPVYAPRPNMQRSKSGSIASLMYKLGLAQTQKDANIVMGCIIAACLFVSALMFMLVAPHSHPIDQAKLQTDLARMRATTGASSQNP